MLRLIATIVVALIASACASTTNTVEGGPSARGFVRVRSDFASYTIVFRMYDAKTGDIVDEGGLVRLVHPIPIWRSADPDTHYDFVFEARPGLYVFQAFTFSYGNTSGQTCFGDTFSFELVEGLNNYVGSYAAIGPGRYSTYAVLTRDADALDEANAAFRALAETEEALTLSVIQPATTRREDCGTGDAAVIAVP